MQTKLVILIAVLAFGLGVLAYPLIFGTSSEPIVPDILIARAKPDTVTVDSYIKIPVPYRFEVTITDTVTEIDTIWIEKKVPYFKSFKAFEFDYVGSKIWAWAESPVDSFKNELTIDWQTYFIDKQKPILTRAKYEYFVIGGAVGLSAGLLATLLIK